MQSKLFDKFIQKNIDVSFVENIHKITFFNLIFLKRKERFKKGDKKQMKEKLKYNTVEGIQKRNNKITFRWTKSKKYLLNEFLKINSDKSQILVNIHIKLNKINQNIFSIKDWKNDVSKDQNKHIITNIKWKHSKKQNKRLSENSKK